MEYIYFFAILIIFVVLSYVILYTQTKSQKPILIFMALLVSTLIILPWVIPTCYDNVCDEQKKKCPKCPGCK